MRWEVSVTLVLGVTDKRCVELVVQIFLGLFGIVWSDQIHNCFEHVLLDNPVPEDVQNFAWSDTKNAMR